MHDIGEFETFMRNHQNMVFSTAVRLLGNETDAADISQEVFVRAHDHFDDLRSSPTAGGWLKTVARNLSLNHLKRYRMRWRFFSEMGNEDDDRNYASSIAAPDTGGQPMDEERERAVLEAALRKLPAAQRVPLVLYHFEDLSYEDIAARLRISLSKVKTDIHRGRAALRRRLRFSVEGELSTGASAAPDLLRTGAIQLI
jgi:RNA polymerase sigma-70 factor (ECF subfamily)